MCYYLVACAPSHATIWHYIHWVMTMYFRRIEDLRHDNDLTQEQVANLLFCHREVYRRYEKGTCEIPISYAIILAEYYDVSLDYMLGLTDTKHPYPRK